MPETKEHWDDRSKEDCWQKCWRVTKWQDCRSTEFAVRCHWLSSTTVYLLASRNKFWPDVTSFQCTQKNIAAEVSLITNLACSRCENEECPLNDRQYFVLLDQDRRRWWCSVNERSTQIKNLEVKGAFDDWIGLAWESIVPAYIVCPFGAIPKVFCVSLDPCRQLARLCISKTSWQQCSISS